MDIMGMVTIFVAVAIILGIAVTILGNTSSSIACWQLEGANNGTGTGASTGVTASNFDAKDSTGWAKACASIQTQSQNSFNLLLVVLIVIAAVIILAVVRML